MPLFHSPPPHPRRPRRPAAPSVTRAPRAEPLESRVLLAVFTVTTTADTGPGSLRQAIMQANAGPDPDEIRFDIPGQAVHTIAPLSALPDVTQPVTIDGSTQPGYSGMPSIELDGAGAGPAADGLRLVSGASTIRGLAINRFNRNGVTLSATGAKLEACFVGIDPAGAAARGNGTAGVAVTTAPFAGVKAQIGGTLPSQRNIISGNAGPGIRVSPPAGNTSSSVDAIIQGNFIGTDASGGAAVGNAQEGVRVDVPGNLVTYTALVGGTEPGAANVISGNGFSGLRLSGRQRATIQGNRIGTDASGQRALGNGAAAGATYRDGITFSIEQLGYTSTIGGRTVSARNVISGNAGAGISATGPASGYLYGALSIQGNYIGTDSAGRVAIGNHADGIAVSSISPNILANLISGNGGDGIHSVLSRSYSTYEGNYIGTDATGAIAMGNAGDGIDLTNCQFLEIGHFAPQASTPPPPSIDPAGSGRNIISGNGGVGVRASQEFSFSFDLQGNYIGTDAGGTVGLGNHNGGVLVSGGRVRMISGGGNVISANGGDGIRLSNVSISSVMSNRIGTDAGGSTPLGNAGNGLTIQDSSGVTVGQGPPQQTFGNRIAYNGGSGIAIVGNSSSIHLSANLVYSNGAAEIDLGADGVTPNDAGDADAGPNLLQNFPVITDVGAVAVTPLPVRSTVRFMLDAVPQTAYRVEFFAAATRDPNGHGGAERFVGYTSVTTDAAGHAAATAAVDPVFEGEFVTSTAMDPRNNTSEFAEAVAATFAGIVGRFALYNDSAADGGDPTADAPDDAAIATDKYPLLMPDEATTFASITSYSRGINGIVIDLANVPDGAVLTQDDFDFRAGAGTLGYDWSTAPDPSSVTLRRGAGVGGSDRVALAWDDAPAVKNGWLQVTVKATPNTGLSRPDVFYFGNLVGSTGEPQSPLKVDNADLAALRRRLGRPPTGTDRAYDFDQDGAINVRDLAIARANFARTLSPLSAPPQPAPPVLPASTLLDESQRPPPGRRRHYDAQ